MKAASFAVALTNVLTLVVAACAEPAPAVTEAGPVSVAVDLGGSSRVPRIAGLAGEGEGYGTAVAAVPTAGPAMDQESMPGMDHGAMPGMAAPSTQAQTAQAQHAHVQGTGTVKAVDAAGHKATLAHNAIPAIGWPAMTMEFAVDPSLDLGRVKPGSRVDFTMMQGPDGMYVIHAIKPAAGGQ